MDKLRSSDCTCDVHGYANLISANIYNILGISFFFLVFLLFISGCKPQDPMVLLKGKTMGTTYLVRYLPDDASIDKDALHKLIDSKLKSINNIMSTYIPDSELSILNTSKEGKYKISDELLNLLILSKNYNALSKGSFDVTVGPVVNLWGFGPNGKRIVPGDEKIKDALSKVGSEKFELVKNENLIIKKTSELYIDLSSNAKGWGVDEIAKLLRSKNIKNFLVEIGGEIKAEGKKPSGNWTVAIENPSEEIRGVQKVLGFKGAMATSGSYRNYFKSNGHWFSHTINPKTGRPVEHKLLSVTVLDEKSCAVADTLSTTLMVMGPEIGLDFAERHGIAAYFITLQEQTGQKEGTFVETQTSHFKDYLNKI